MNLYEWESEWRLQELKEESFMAKYVMDKSSKWVSLVQHRVPASLQKTLDNAFTKAFVTVFDKGASLIEKTYNKESAEKNFEENMQAFEEDFSSSSIKRFDRQAGKTTMKNLTISSVEGVGLGLFGVGLPDIPVFVSVLLKSIYEIAISYGFDYRSNEEKLFILNMIDASLHSGNTLKCKNEELNEMIDLYVKQLFENEISEDEMDEFVTELQIVRQIDDTAKALSEVLLYGKFVQSMYVVGVIGGTADITCLKRVTDYAKLKYKRRFLIIQKKKSQQSE